MITQSLLELRSELAAPLVEGAGRGLCSQAQRARYVLAGLRVAPTTDDDSSSSSSSEAKNSEGKVGRSSGGGGGGGGGGRSSVDGAPKIAPMPDPATIPGETAVEITELLATDSEPEVASAKAKLIACVKQVCVHARACLTAVACAFVLAPPFLDV